MMIETQPHYSYYPRSYTDGKILETTHRYRHVQKSDKCDKMGEVIRCPYCHSHSTVYHLEWSALTCDKCDNSVEKEDWLIQLGYETGEWVND